MKIGKTTPILAVENIEASIAGDLPKISAELKAGSVLLYSEVDSIDQAADTLRSEQIVVPHRTTFYGAKEIWIRDRNGIFHGFAEHG